MKDGFGFLCKCFGKKRKNSKNLSWLLLLPLQGDICENDPKKKYKQVLELVKYFEL